MSEKGNVRTLVSSETLFKDLAWLCHQNGLNFCDTSRGVSTGIYIYELDDNCDVIFQATAYFDKDTERAELVKLSKRISNYLAKKK